MGLPVVVAVAHIGCRQGEWPPPSGAALIGAGMLSVLVVPTLALRLRARAPAPAGG